MSATFKISGAVRVGTLSGDPSNPEQGLIYFNTSTNTFRLYENGAFRVISAEQLEAHLNGGASKHDATEIDYERSDGSKKDIQAASDDVETALTDLDDNKISKTGSIAFTADQSMGGNQLTNVGDPVADTDAANKGYVDSVAQGLDVKESVRAATTIAGTLATSFEDGDVIDGVTLATGDRILIKNQADAEENGIYEVQASGAPSRTLDADEDSEVSAGLFVFVEEGTANADTGWVLTTDNPITLDTTELVFTQFTGAGTIIAGDGLTKSGNTLSVNVDDSTIEINADTLRVKDNGITNAKLADMAAWTLKLRNAGTSGDPSDAASGDITTEATPASGDFVVGFLDTNEIRKFDVNALPISSATQTALNGKASTALSNLASVAINTSLISDTDNTDDLGSSSINWKDVHAKSIKSTNGLTSDADSDAGGDRANAHTMLASSHNRGKQGTNLVEEEYVHSITLASGQSGTAITELTFAHATYEGLEFVYKQKEATSNDVRIGTVRVVTNGSSVVLSDVSTETAPTGITFSAAINGANVEVRYDSGANAVTMRADVKRIKA